MTQPPRSPASRGPLPPEGALAALGRPGDGENSFAHTTDALSAAGWRQRSSPGYTGRFGPLWTRKEENGWAYGVLPTAEHLNPAGAVHGGVFASLMDHAVSAVAWEALGRQPCVTVQLDTQFLQAARVGQFLEARAQVVRAAGSLVFMRGTVSHAGEALCQGSAVLKRVKPPQA